ncbi:MAG TPA: response regulator [Anaeromyxobacteraceae bacterium]|nr:response regulator [Anaeromyxobacteraceae bacterium]
MTPLASEEALLGALDRALEAGAAAAAPVGVVTLRDAAGGDAAVRLAAAAMEALPAGGVAGLLSADRVALVLPGFGAAAARDVARRLAETLPQLRVGSAASAPDGAPRGPADLIAEAESVDDPGRHRILVVEDEPMLAQVIQAFLAASGGYHVVLAHSGDEALALCRQVVPALVLVDLELPDVDGAELLRRIRGEVRDVPAIACSGKRPESAAGAGFTAFFRKPFDMRALVAEVERLLKAQALGVP